MTRHILKKVWHFLVRMDVASVLIFLVLLLAASGSFFPQITSELTNDSQRLAQWEEATQIRYGNSINLLKSLGIFTLYKSILFIVCFALLALSTLLCTLNRWKSIWRQVFHRQIRCSDIQFDTTKNKSELILKGDEDCKIFLGILSAKGFRLHSEVDEDIHHFRADRYPYTPLGSLISHLGAILLLFGTMISSAFSWRYVVTVKAGENFRLLPIGWQILNDGFIIERNPDGSVADYVAQVKITNPELKLIEGLVRPNEPVKAGDLVFYLTGFNSSEGNHAITLLIVHDPSYTWVLLAGFLVFLGMTMSFNFPNCCIYARLMPDGFLRLAGRADRRAYDFDYEFQALMRELEGKMVKNPEEA